MGVRGVPFFGGLRGRRGALEVGVVVLVCALVAGAVVGSGLAQTVLKTPDALTWLRNNRGEVNQINPDTGTVVDKLRVGRPGDPLRVVQGNGVLVVTNLATGAVSIVDLSTLRIVGVRQGDSTDIKVLLNNRQIYLVNKPAGRVETLDPLTAATIGQPWQAGTELSDAVVDTTGELWTLTGTGRLTSLQWSPANRTFTEHQHRDLTGTGAGAVLVAHEQGATALDPRGTVTRVGTHQDRTLQADRLTAPLAAADLSPAQLAPVSSPQSGSLNVVRDNGAVQVDGRPLDCKPDKPAVYRDHVYVPCRGGNKVIVLNPDGTPAQPPLPVPGDAELVTNAGLLIINVPTAKTGLVVKPDGTTQPIRTDDPTVPVNNPNARPTALPTGLGLRPGQQPDPNTGQNNNKPPTTKKPDAPKNTGGPTARPTQNTATATPGPTASPGPVPSGPSTSPGGDIGLSPNPTLTGGPTPSDEPFPTDEPAPTDEPLPTDEPAPTEPAPTEPQPTEPSPTPSPPPSDADFTPSGVDATAQPNGMVIVFWTPPRIPPDSYRILRADTEEVVANPPTGVDEARISGLVGQQISFIVVAVTGGREYRSAPSPPASPVPPPAAPSVSLQLVALAPTGFTVRVTVGVVGPATSYGVSVTVNGTSRVLNRTDLPPSSPTSDFTFPCTGAGDPCLTGGSVTADARATSEAGLGAIGTANLAIPGPPAFAYGQAFMYVSTGGKCLDVDLKLHTCTGATNQMWTHEGDRRAIRNQSNGRCLAVNDAIHLAGDGCTDDPKKWSRINPNGNEALLFASIGGECVRILGDPAGEGVPVGDPKNCSDAPTERWTAWRQAGGVPLASASTQPASVTLPVGDGPIGAPVLALLILPLAAGLFRRTGRAVAGRATRRQRRRNAR